MSTVYAYISTKTTVDPYIPTSVTNLTLLARDVSDAFVSLSGGYQMVGQLKFFPIQRSVPGHLLCDGKEVPKDVFPQLYSYLGDTQGTPVNAANFVLPNYIGGTAFTPATTAEVETVNDGTVIQAVPTTPPTDQFAEYFLNQWNSSGRPRKLDEVEPPV